MKGNSEFLVLFIPFLLVGFGAFYIAWFYPLQEILLNPILTLIGQIILTLVGIFCTAVDIFALMVQYVNWKYYNGGDE